MNKSDIHSALISALEQQWQAALKAADTAQEAASDSENKPENQYDTLALEAAYLAHGQSERVLELEQALLTCKKMPIKSFSDDNTIALGALVELADGKQLLWFYLSPVGGGIVLNVKGSTITVINPKAPVACLLTGKLCGDEIELPNGGLYEILSVY
ncbi:transcription elongation factor [Endozoicomonas sp. OPT23]|uniref:transcription elongation factor n=1 Tax=Endozoicomonas sp. OPT23 TaxID=2072845 RepID=UPI00129AE5EF|nr:transcription elongation factor [Endozoicomonas sp. OPT23]MRI32620.1 transcription elongation factor [Endozoicomonas sp. OPT23]